MQHLIRPDILNLEPYLPIVPFDVLSERLGRAPSEIVKLDANENPYGASPSALAKMATGEYYHIYPDPESNALRSALSDYLQLPKERILCGMGADELIDLILRVLLAPGDGVIDCPPTFGMYIFSTAVNSGDYIEVTRHADFTLDIDGIESAVATHPNAKVLFITSPNNPDGSCISDEELRRLLALPLVVVLDEAYVEFSTSSGYPSRAHWTFEYDNLITLRTFSKLAGLAGLRVGYGIFPEWIVPHILKIKQPYNVHAAASLAAIGALEDQAWLNEKVQALVDERARVIEALSAFDFLHPYPSHANFVLFRVTGRSARDLKLALEREGILVRYYNKRGLDNCIRISIGRTEQTDKLITALQKIS